MANGERCGFGAGRSGRGRRGRLLAELLETRHLLSTITVTSAGDADGADGSNTLSLRQAIEVSNGTLAVSTLTPAQQGLVVGALSNPNTIDFNIPGTGPFIIEPASALPAIIAPAVVDGYSQPGARPDTNGPRQGDNAALEIELNGTLAGPGASGLDLTTGGILRLNSTVRGLAIGGFSGAGLSIGVGDVVEGNFIGTDITGTKALPNAIGINPTTSNYGTKAIYDTIGGTAAGAGNIISGNAGDGLILGSDSLVESNFIGTDATGARPLPNGRGIAPTGGTSGLGGNDTIGGTAAGAGNVISGNAGDGLALGPASLVEGNFIGTDVTGTRPPPNGGDGIRVSGTFADGYSEVSGNDTIGGTAAGAGNVISGNAGDGLALGPASLVEGNFIGTDLVGAHSLPNGGDGIDVVPPGDLPGAIDMIGGTAAGAANVIAFNGGSGVNVAGRNLSNSLTGHATVSANAIFANKALGIDLGGDGVTPNNPAGSPTGPNLLQPYPVITSAIPNGLATSISATLDATPFTSYTVEFFFNSAPDPSGYGQGQAYLGTTVATTDVTGHAAFTLTVPSNLLGDVISATATDPKGNTSEFARDVTAGPMVPSTTTLIGPSAAAVFGHAVTFAAVVASTSGVVPTGMVAFGAGGVYLGEAPLNSAGVAVFITNRLPLGSDVVEALYLGDPASSISLSNFVSVTIQPISPLTSLIGPTSPGVLGRALTFAAIVSPTVGDNTPTGTVFFAEGGTSLGEAPLDSAGVAVFITDRLPVGPNVVAAGYLGDPRNATSLSNYVLARVLPTAHGKSAARASGITPTHPPGPRVASRARKAT